MNFFEKYLLAGIGGAKADVFHTTSQIIYRKKVFHMEVNIKVNRPLELYSMVGLKRNSLNIPEEAMRFPKF